MLALSAGHRNTWSADHKALTRHCCWLCFPNTSFEMKLGIDTITWPIKSFVDHRKPLWQPAVCHVRATAAVMIWGQQGRHDAGPALIAVGYISAVKTVWKLGNNTDCNITQTIDLSAKPTWFDGAYGALVLSNRLLPGLRVKPVPCKET